MNRDRIGNGSSGASPSNDASTTVNFQAVASLDPQMSAGSTVTVSITASVGIPTPDLRVQVSQASKTLGGTMRAAGTSPPVVTLAAGTGSLTYSSNCPGIKVIISDVSGGTALGQAKFDISYDSGNSWAHTGVTTTASYSIPDGVAAGNVVGFPAGTYGVDQSWEGTAATVRSTEGNSYTFTQATASIQPVFRHASSTADGKSALFFAGAQYLRSTDAAVYNIFSNDPAFTLAYRVAYTAADALGTVCGPANSGSSNKKRRFGQSVLGNGRQSHSWFNDAGTNATNDSTADNTSTSAVNVEWDSAGSNSTIQVRVNNGSNQGPAGTQNIGTLTTNRLSIGAEDDNVAGVFLSGLFYDLILYSSQKGASDLGNINTALANGTS
jgi:hypothetical protein